MTEPSNHEGKQAREAGVAAVLTENTLLPALRPDLQLSGESVGAGVSQVHIKDPVSQRSLSVRGFELSICRMINGVRTAGELVAAAQTIGIPLDVAKLSVFLARLGQLGFLVAANAPAPRASAPVNAELQRQRSLTWSGRKMWSAETRQRYQEALKEARLDHLEAAKARVVGLLEKSPDIEEAKVLLAWLDEQISSKAEGKARVSFAEAFAEVEAEWAAEQSQGHPLRDRSSRRGVRLVAVSLLGVLGLLVFMPLPHQVVARWSVEAPPAEPLVLQRAGRLEQVRVREGQRVEANAELARYDGSNARELAQRLEAAREALKKAKKADRAAAQRLVKDLERERLVKREGSDVVTAPVAGVVRALTASAGSVVEVGQQLCRLEAPERPRLVVEVDPHQVLEPAFTIELQGRRIALVRDSEALNHASAEVEGLAAGSQGNLTVSLEWRSFLRR
ncbi:MAG: hypothetical protein IPJ65_38740 [Archangiaceae bacterium]|nr:hypothetical protein [Archangiaceae bacterium]